MSALMLKGQDEDGERIIFPFSQATFLFNEDSNGHTQSVSLSFNSRRDYA